MQAPRRLRLLPPHEIPGPRAAFKYNSGRSTSGREAVFVEPLNNMGLGWQRMCSDVNTEAAAATRVCCCRCVAVAQVENMAGDGAGGNWGLVRALGATKRLLVRERTELGGGGLEKMWV
jgi:hypothetical protein